MWGLMRSKCFDTQNIYWHLDENVNFSLLSVAMLLWLQTSQAEQERRLLSGENKEQSNEFHVESAEYLKMLMAHADEKEQ